MSLARLVAAAVRVEGRTKAEVARDYRVSRRCVHELVRRFEDTIAVHLQRRRGASPSVATIWRVLSRRGFVTPRPQKRPKSSFVRFEAEMPNERWQADITHWKLAGGTEIEILNVLDDHSRFLVALGTDGRSGRRTRS